jgi:molybdopterin-guanine dinucleotide biosynthesis protein A
MNKAVLLAAGRGTRMRELTAELPKPTLPVRGKPVSQPNGGTRASIKERRFEIADPNKSAVANRRSLRLPALPNEIMNKAVLLAAGRGTRMRELTAELPKPTLPVRGKPVSQPNGGTRPSIKERRFEIADQQIGGCKPPLLEPSSPFKTRS